ncbi:sensor domain-containing diguanylate cyclase [Novosphingobium lentum]|uniref:sensor domain-containing diguanylate cyclase n=1 Tax=Novosphingobium lentum TaxID=145287 RepID=UPI0008316E4A|nr:sensor domain-containing diguanylate cyclase [Novosphingobium lentum]
MAPFTNSRLRAIFVPVAIGLAYYTSALLSLTYARGAEGIAVMWPASGLILACLIIVTPRHRIPVVIATAIASLCANLASGEPVARALGFTFSNTTEPLLAVILLWRMGSAHPRFDTIRDVARFCLATATASLWSAATATGFAGLGRPFFLSWMTTVFLGMMLVTPIACTVAHAVRKRPGRLTGDRSAIEVAAWLLAIAAVSLLVFSQDVYPVMFLPPVVVLAATYRLRVFGAASGALIVAVIASLLTGRNAGPVHHVPGGHDGAILFLQFYLLVILASALPQAASLTARERLARKLSETNRLLKQAEAAAQVGHWRIELGTGHVFWSDEVYKIFGRDPANAPDFANWLDGYPAIDRARVSALLGHTIASGERFEFQADVARPDGTMRHVMSRGEAERVGDGTGEVIAIFGSIQDITVHVENVRKLEDARREAETAAKSSLHLANTDVLTGLPNRRHTMDALERAIASARLSGEDLSIAMFDIDHFKAINDLHGHAHGDQILRRVAACATASRRADDLIGRIGGEEFLILLPGAAPDVALRAAERIRAAIEDGLASGDAGPNVTVSVGVASLRTDLTCEALLHLADTALYTAKAEGRNIIRLRA